MRKLNEKHNKEAAVSKYEIRRLKEELKTVTGNSDRLKQLLDDQKRRSVDVRSKFDRDMMNLLKKNEQQEATLKDFKEKQGKGVAALKDEIKRLKALDQLQKAEKGCDQAKDKSAMMITQLEAENAYKNKKLDNATAEARNARMKEDKSKLRES
nr:unnamed protein product [Callosobruchus chinensis]